MIKQAASAFSFQNFARLLFQNRKKAGLYGGLFIVIAFNLCLFLGANMHSPDNERTVTVIQLVSFAFMGIINVWIFYKRNFLEELSLSGAKLAFICLLFIVMALVLFLYYYISGNNELIMAFASSGAFFLPFLICQGWTAWMTIPPKNYPVWYLPSVEIPAMSATANSMQVQLQIARKANDVQTHIYPVTVSARVKLGKTFEMLVATHEMQERKNSIQVKDNQEQLFAWQFYEEKWAGLYRRHLDPSRSLTGNKIKPNAKIVIIRKEETN
ncbi:MAG: TssN family type VI secretion system protein [Chitinophagaceae bacterium]